MEYVRPHVLFNDINHGKSICFLDFRVSVDYQMCHLRNSVNLTVDCVNDIDCVLNERFGNCKLKSVQLYWLTEEEPSPELVSMFNERVVKNSVWSKIKSSEWVNYDEFYSLYGRCQSLFEGEAVQDNNPSTFTNEYPSEILPKFLFLGNFFAATDSVVLQSLGITHILDASGELSSKDCAAQLNIVYLPITIRDRGSVDISEYFEKVNTFIEECRSVEGGRILIHCQAGISRSATFVLAYLLYSQIACDLKDALCMVLEQRPYICPNAGFRHQLMQYEFELIGFNSFESDRALSDFIEPEDNLGEDLVFVL